MPPFHLPRQPLWQYHGQKSSNGFEVGKQALYSLTYDGRTAKCALSSDYSVRKMANRSKGGMIRSSINLPAQSLYHTIPALYKVFSAARLKKVVWYCGS
jgi:hypothetical protein